MALGFLASFITPQQEKKKKPVQQNYDDLIGDIAAVSQNVLNEAKAQKQIDNVASGQASTFKKEFEKAGQQGTKGTEEKAIKQFQVRQNPTNLKSYTEELTQWRSSAEQQIDEQLNQLKDAGYDANEIESARQSALADLDKNYQSALKGSANESKKFVNDNAALISPQERKAVSASIKDVTGEEKTFTEQIAESGFGGAIENIQTGVEQGLGRAVKEGAGLLSTPKAVNEFLAKNPQIATTLRVASPGVSSALDLLGLTGASDKLNEVGTNINQAATQFQTEGERGERKQFNPIASQVGEFAGAAAPYIAAEVLTGGAASGAAVKPLIERGLAGIANPFVKRLVSGGLSGAAENVVGEAIVNPGRQYQESGDFSGQQFAQDLGIAAGAGGLFGGAFEGAGQAFDNIKNRPQAKAPDEVPIQQAELIPPVPPKIEPKDLKQQTYAESTARIREINKAGKSVSKAIKEAEIEGDYSRAAQPKILHRRTNSMEKLSRTTNR